MEDFQAILPSVLLAPYIKQYWFLKVANIGNGSQRFIPAGSLGIVFNRGERFYSSLENSLLPGSYVFGQATTYTNLTFSNLDLIIIVLNPMGAKALFKMPIYELNGQSIDIDLLNDPQIMELEDRLMNITDNQTCVYWIEQFLLRHLSQFNEYNFNRLTSVINTINNGETDISALAKTACLSHKQFKRIFVEYVGLNPKEFLQIIRFSKAVRMLQTQSLLTLNELSYECGYSDKSHLIKEIKRFSGYTPTEFRENSDPYSDYMSLFQSFFINISTVKYLLLHFIVITVCCNYTY